MEDGLTFPPNSTGHVVTTLATIAYLSCYKCGASKKTESEKVAHAFVKKHEHRQAGGNDE